MVGNTRMVVEFQIRIMTCSSGASGSCVWYARVKRAGLLMRELFFMLFAALAVSLCFLAYFLAHRLTIDADQAPRRNGVEGRAARTLPAR